MTTHCRPPHWFFFYGLSPGKSPEFWKRFQKNYFALLKIIYMNIVRAQLKCKEKLNKHGSYNHFWADKIGDILKVVTLSLKNNTLIYVRKNCCLVDKFPNLTSLFQPSLYNNNKH